MDKVNDWWSGDYNLNFGAREDYFRVHFRGFSGGRVLDRNACSRIIDEVERLSPHVVFLQLGGTT